MCISIYILTYSVLTADCRKKINILMIETRSICTSEANFWLLFNFGLFRDQTQAAYVAL